MFNESFTKLAVIVFFMCGATAWGGDLADGGFETPGVAAGTLQVFTGGSTLGAWTVLGQNVLLVQTTYSEPFHNISQFNAEQGQNSLDLTGSANSGPTDGVQQVVSTLPNHVYNLSFWVGTASGDAVYSTPATDNLSINGGALIPFTNPNFSPGIVNWEKFTYQFTATATNTTIAFLNGTPANTNFAGLDNVSLAAVPEPSSGILCLLAGVALLPTTRVRRLLFRFRHINERRE